MFSREGWGTGSSTCQEQAELTHPWPCISCRAGSQALAIRQVAPRSFLALPFALRERVTRRNRQPGSPQVLNFQVTQLSQLPASRAKNGPCDQGRAQLRALGAHPACPRSPCWKPSWSWWHLPSRSGDFGAGSSLASDITTLKMTLYQQQQVLQTRAGYMYFNVAFHLALDLLMIHLR